MTVEIEVDKIRLTATGTYTSCREASDGIAYFEIEKIVPSDPDQDIWDLFEWAGARGSHAITDLEELCLNQIC